MTFQERILPSGEPNSFSSETKHSSTNLISTSSLLPRLERSKEARSAFVQSHLDKSIAFQIRSLREQGQWTQAQFAKILGIKHQNNVSARLENPKYGKHSLTTLKKIAATCDVALVVSFIPYSRWLKWATGTPQIDYGLSDQYYNIAPFDSDSRLGDTGSAEFVPQGRPQRDEELNRIHLVKKGTGAGMELVDDNREPPSKQQQKETLILPFPPQGTAGSDQDQLRVAGGRQNE